MCAKLLQKQAKTVAVMIWKKFEDRHQTDRQTDRQWYHQSPILQKPAAQLKKRNETVCVISLFGLKIVLRTAITHKPFTGVKMDEWRTLRKTGLY